MKFEKPVYVQIKMQRLSLLTKAQTWCSYPHKMKSKCYWHGCGEEKGGAGKICMYYSASLYFPMPTGTRVFCNCSYTLIITGNQRRGWTILSKEGSWVTRHRPSRSSLFPGKGSVSGWSESTWETYRNNSIYKYYSEYFTKMYSITFISSERTRYNMECLQKRRARLDGKTNLAL